MRRTAWKNALREFEWFLSGSSNINDLHPKVHSWWKPWADSLGNIKNNYSKQFRAFAGEGTREDFPYPTRVDQLQNTIKLLTDDPQSRRNIITTWNSADMQNPETPITNCHGTVIQFFVDSENKLHMTMYQRSCDMMLGVPHNWIQYWAFLHWLAFKTNRSVGTFHWHGGDCHIYENHWEAARELVGKFNRMSKHGEELESPNLIYTPQHFEFKADDFSLDAKYEPVLKYSLPMTE